tara:strand:- start:70 stop:345 length:276 start_codon:yes stop_codon:yes gene_type:complete
MGVDEFYDMLPREFWNKVDGFYELENLRQRNDWERTRWSTCLLLNIQLPKNKTIKPTELIEFEWDEKKKDIDFKKLKERAEYIKKMEENGK